MQLLIDAGNTRLKWYHWQRRVVASGWLDYACLPALFANEHRFSRILVSSVRGEAFAESLTRLCLDAGETKPEFAAVNAVCGGVKVGYREPHKLGVDRWLAMLAAYSKASGACVVIDAGTAVTADFVSVEGKHLGGLIIPGAQTMGHSLLAKTHGAGVASLTLPQAWQLGRDTVSCVEFGVAAALKGFVNEVAEHTKMLAIQDSGWLSATIYLTGGDAQAIQEWLPLPAQTELALIAEGLLLAFDNNNRN